jgi:hypothetical protein
MLSAVLLPAVLSAVLCYLLPIPPLVVVRGRVYYVVPVAAAATGVLGVTLVMVGILLLLVVLVLLLVVLVLVVLVLLLVVVVVCRVPRRLIRCFRISSRVLPRSLSCGVVVVIIIPTTVIPHLLPIVS